MPFPDFFDTAPSVTLLDPLCRFLGAGDGVLTYRYEDAVKLAGHSCPTVAGSWLMLSVGLKTLWPDGMPERGKIRVDLPEAADEGTAGVVAAIASLLTGARAEDGFKGIAGEFRRCGLMAFGAPVFGVLTLKRIDTGKTAALGLDLSSIPIDERQAPLLGKWRSNQARPDEIALFGQIWQDRVKRIFQAGDELVRLQVSA
ncbi:MAG TPA: hypothetical protein VM661_12125 [Candidatus Sulfotelmatobacter sp.]|jgi:hypothetical protein|nr:hypothetical protein [Candidatus Sulfotelmatobacter sp.]